MRSGLPNVASSMVCTNLFKKIRAAAFHRIPQSAFNKTVLAGTRFANFSLPLASKKLMLLLSGVVFLLTATGQAAVPAAQVLGGLPLFFEARAVGDDTSPQYLAKGLNYQISIAPTEVYFAFHKLDRPPASSSMSRRPLASPSSVLTRFARLQFLGANRLARPQGQGEMEGKVNYLIGNDPAKWRAQVPVYSSVQVAQLYPGIDLLYYGNQHQLEYDITVSPDAEPTAIAMRFEGLDHLVINDQGEMVVSLGGSEMHQRQPVIYQMIDDVRRVVSGGYRLIDEQTIGFSVGPYNKRFPLIIDPIFSYSTFFGGNGGETGLSVKVDASGSVYLAGQTISTQFPFPIPANGFQKQFNGGGKNGDAFAAKLDNTGSRLLYFTYLGGSADDTALDLALDNAGNAYLTGFTDSPDFPTRNALFGKISGTLQTTLNIYPLDGFVAELNAQGSGLVYSTYLGGSANDVGSAIAVDPAGNTYVTGYANSSDFPVRNAFQARFNGLEDAFVAKIGPNGLSLIYSTYLGGALVDRGEGIAADAAGYAYVAGYTDSANFPTRNAESPSLNGAAGAISVYDAFVTRIAPNGLALMYSTYLGGSNNDFGYRITVDAAQNAYVTGAAQSPNFPHRDIGLEIGNNGTNALNYDAFITRLNSSGTRTYSILFGGTSDEEGWDVAVDGAGRAFVIGSTLSTNFPVISPGGLFRTVNSGRKDAFVTVFNGLGTAVHYSAYLGGAADDYGYGIAVDSESNAYITGLTFSSGFPISANAFQASLRGPSSAFLAKIRLFQPGLTTVKSGPNLLLSWPITAPDYLLQSASSLGSAPNWVVVPQAPLVNNTEYSVTVGATNTTSFFRLYRP